jgi:hypothetical protein
VRSTGVAIQSFRHAKPIGGHFVRLPKLPFVASKDWIATKLRGSQ